MCLCGFRLFPSGSWKHKPDNQTGMVHTPSDPAHPSHDPRGCCAHGPCTQPCHAAGMLRAALSCCSLTPTAFQFTTQPNSTPQKSIFISRERLCAYSTAVGEGPGEEGRTPSSINAAAASLYPTHLQIPELCEEKGDLGVLISMPGAWKHREAGEVEALTGGDEQGHSHPSAVPRSWPRCRSPAAQGSRCRGAGLRKTRNKNL